MKWASWQHTTPLLQPANFDSLAFMSSHVTIDIHVRQVSLIFQVLSITNCHKLFLPMFVIGNIHLIQVITVMPFITSVQVSWTTPTSMEDNFDYDLQYYPTSFPSLVVTLNTNHTSLLVIGLLPQLHYHFQVRVTNVDQPTWSMADVQLH